MHDCSFPKLQVMLLASDAHLQPLVLVLLLSDLRLEL